MNKIKGANDYISFNEIIYQAIENDFPEEKCIYKLKKEDNPQDQDSSIAPMLLPLPGSENSKTDKISNRFLSMRVKK